MRGLLVFYVNYRPEFNEKPDQQVDAILQMNKGLLDKIQKELGYEIMFVPTTNESCRVQRIDFENHKE